MEAYEFHTTLFDGTIHIPVEYRDKLFGKVRVILMLESATMQNTNNPDRVGESPFPYYAVDTTGYVFNREEANER